MGKKNKKLSNSVQSRRQNKKKTATTSERNPFEVRVHRLKHDVVGKKVKTDRGLPGVSRSKANEKRKRTLLKEYKQRFKSNTIIDRRFGEFDENLSIEEKMLKRFAMEKQKHHEKSSMYNLNDDEDEEDILTHMGQNIGDIDNFDDAALKLSDNEDDDGEEHFGGFLKKKKKADATDDQDDVIDKMSNRKMSKQEIMDEVVANSKRKKFERQQNQEKAFELTQKLDAEFRDILPLLNRVKERKREPCDDYDVTVNELFFEGKTAKATDRLKTEEEVAREEKAKLEELEKQRRMRMLGITDENDAEDNDDHATSADALISNKKKKKDERFELQYEDGKMVLPDDAMEEITKDEDGDSGTGGEDDESENEGESDEEEESDHEDIYSDEEENAGGDSSSSSSSEDDDKQEEVKKTEKKRENRKTKQKSSKVDNDIPFIFEAPKDLSDFLPVVNGRTNEDVVTICQRIRKCHHVKLDSNNTSKMEDLFDVMLDYLDHLANEPIPQLKLIKDIAEFVNEISNDVKAHASQAVLKKLKILFKKINKRIKLRGEPGMFPTLSELVFFKTIALIYPTSDLNHPITTPTLILIAMVLAKGHCKNIKDIVSGLYLMEIVYEYTKLAKRYLPEVIIFLSKLLFLSASVKTKIDNFPAALLFLRKEEKDLLLVSCERIAEPSPIDLSTSLSLQTDVTTLNTDEFRHSCVHNLLCIAKKFCTLYVDLSSYNEIFSPCYSLLQRLPHHKFHKKTKELYNEVLSLMSSRQNAVKIPLTMQARKPKPLPLFEPEFDENYEIRPKRRAGDKEQNEIKKLKYKLKKETKGAIREIRKDAQFLAKEGLKERLQKDKVRKDKVKELHKQIENERREIKEMEKGR